MDYIRSNLPSIFRGQKRLTELILPFMYTVVPGSENDYLAASLCKFKAPFAVYAKPIGEKPANLDADAVRKLSVIYDLVLLGPNCVFSIFRSPSQEKVNEEFDVLFPAVNQLSQIDGIPDFWHPVTVKNVCSFTSANKDWPTAHIATFFGWMEAWKSEAIIQNLDLPNPANGEVPLHVAVKRSHMDLIVRFLELNCRLDIVNNMGDTVFHYAATSSPEIIKILGAKCSPVINAVNHADQSPLLLACMAAKQDCIEALFSVGADLAQNGIVPVNSTPASKSLQMQCAESLCKVYPDLLDPSGIKFGGGPLHWCKTKAGTMRFILCNVNVESRNDLGETPLHLMVMRSRLDCAIVLFSHGAKIDVVDYKGNTPLHTAVFYGSLDIVKAMVVFGSDMTIPNKMGDTALHLADTCALSKRRDELLMALSIATGSVTASNTFSPLIQKYRSQLHDEMKKHGQLPDENLPAGLEFLDDSWDETSAVDEDDDGMDDSVVVLGPKRKCRVLCLDGGGIRGLVLIELLMAVEDMVKRPLSECFDWVAGTSTGASIALALATGKDMRHCMALYFRMKDKIFVGSRPYPAETFESVLQEEFGADRKMTDIVGTKVLIPSLLVDRHPPALHMFRNYDHPVRPNHIESIPTKSGPKVLCKPLEPKDQLIWRAARASGAAPTYFRSAENFLDGGLMANNPTLDCLTEIFDYNAYLKNQGRKSEVQEILCVLSLGTGRQPMLAVPSIDVYWPERFWDAAKIGLNASALGRLIIEQACQSEGRVVDRARAWW
ncbi:85/88 kDa calcium-independent phospholipase A2-like [Paramacrobiotus metropolitanus]|uniref:85/88 kDa calcium-independent phospholipase A2-like n=1 Tax=Paramacrobiotus metropolitanus TaxID=2943436 RepID=UPI002445D9FB|nr:85/88 kDa calcium-independent phospholipase A2-like [Paramacrobiotus metropolitanus]